MAKPENRTYWLSLCNWSGLVLQPPERGGTLLMLSRSGYLSSSQQHLPRQGQLALPAASPTTLAQEVTSKLEDGNLRAAIRLLCSEDTPAPPSLEKLNKLQQKHPQASLKDGSLPDPRQYTPLSVDESDVRKAVLSAGNG